MAYDYRDTLELRALIQAALDETTTHAVAWRLQAALNTLDKIERKTK